jgi:thiol-disulfide isomerase/thioredoxin
MCTWRHRIITLTILLSLCAACVPVAAPIATPTLTAALPLPFLPTMTAIPAITPTPPPSATPASTRVPATATPAPELVGFEPVPGRPSVLEFYEEGCGPCVQMQDIVYGLQLEYGDRVTFASAEIDDPAMASLIKTYRARGTPFIILLGKDGQMARRAYGVVEAAQLRRWLDDLLN